jgi:hypothetical protein
VGLDAGGMLLVDTFNFYGHLLGALTLDGSLAIGSRGEVFARMEFFRFQQVITPTPATHLGLGHTTLGGTWRFLIRPKGSLGLTGKVVLPTAFDLYKNAWPIGFDVGLTALATPLHWLSLHAHGGLITSAAITRGDPMPLIGGVITAGLALQPAAGFAFVADLHGNFGYRGPVDVFAGALGVRFSDSKRFGFEIGATIPITGVERSAVRLDLRASIRLGPYRPVPPKEESSAGSEAPAEKAPAEEPPAEEEPAAEEPPAEEEPAAEEPPAEEEPAAEEPPAEEEPTTEEPAKAEPQPEPLQG